MREHKAGLLNLSKKCLWKFSSKKQIRRSQDHEFFLTSHDRKLKSKLLKKFESEC